MTDGTITNMSKKVTVRTPTPKNLGVRVTLLAQWPRQHQSDSVNCSWHQTELTLIVSITPLHCLVTGCLIMVCPFVAQ